MKKKMFLVYLMIFSFFLINGRQIQIRNEERVRILVPYAVFEDNRHTHNAKLFIEMMFQDVNADIDFLEFRNIQEMLDYNFDSLDYDLLFYYKPNTKQYASIKQQAVDISSRLVNYDDLFPNLSDGYYVPISMGLIANTYNEVALTRNDLAVPKLSVDQGVFEEVFREWLAEDCIYLNAYTFEEVFNSYFSDLKFVSESIDYEILAQTYFTMRDELLQWYALDGIYTDLEYKQIHVTYESPNCGYADSVYGNDSEHALLNPVTYVQSVNLLNGIDRMENQIPDTFARIPYSTNRIGLFTYGFVVLDNSSKVDAAIQFLDQLLSEDFQMKLYEKTGKTRRMLSGYVINSIDKRAEQLDESKDVPEVYSISRQEIYDLFESGDFSPYEPDYFYVYEELYETIFKMLFFRVEYTKDDVIEELKKIETFQYYEGGMY